MAMLCLSFPPQKRSLTGAGVLGGVVGGAEEAVLAGAAGGSGGGQQGVGGTGLAPAWGHPRLEGAGGASWGGVNNDTSETPNPPPQQLQLGG